MKPRKLPPCQRAATIATIILSCLAVAAVAAAQSAVTAPDVVIRISRIAEILDLVDRLAADYTGKGGTSATAVARGSLMGTGWINPMKPIVVGIDFVNGAAQTTALVPFVEPNSDFQSAYGAKSGPDYYLLALPQGSAAPMTPEIESALVAAGNTPKDRLVSIEVAVGRLIADSGETIDRMIANIEQSPPPAAEGQAQPPISAAEARDIIKRVVETFKQVDTLRIDFDLDQDTLSLVYEITAAPGSRLAQTFIAGGETVSLGAAPESAQISFATRSYNLAGFLALLGDNFGDFYKKLGIDFDGLEKISRAFTGEMVGGMTLGEDRVDFEFMARLREDVTPEAFLEEAYIPWLLEYGRQMRATVQQAVDESAPEAISLTPESTVAGRRVFGCRVEMPAASVPGPAGAVPSSLPITGYDMRMTTVGPVLAVASTDARLAGLIERAGNAQERPADGGPLMTGEIDLAGYLTTLRSWVQRQAGELPPLPALGKMAFEGDMGQGRASFSLSVRVKDLTALAAYAATLKPPAAEPAGTASAQRAAGGQTTKPETKATQQSGTLRMPPQRKAVAVTKDAAYWSDRAYLCTTYGNDASAIHFFKKAIALSPKSSNLYFQMGVSYAELGYYQAALAAIDKAISLGGAKGVYYFGRGRVLLQSGKKEQGLAEIRKAADMGEPDAVQYLRDLTQKAAG